MTVGALLRKGYGIYSRNGAVRAVGIVAGFCGRRVDDRCRWLAKIRERDRGKSYPLRLRLRAARRGRSAHMYRFMGLDDADANVDRYLTDGSVGELNEGYITPFHDKYAFQLSTEPYLDGLPTMHGLLDGGELTAPLAPRSGGDLFALLERVGTLVVKPRTGGKGAGVHVLARRETEWLVDGDPTTAAALSTLVAGLEEYVVTEFVEQHPYADAVFPDATNTLRVHSLLDPETGEPSVFRPVHRFGSAVSAPTDNGSRGGYVAPVDEETGEVGRLIVLDGLVRSRPARHPETGSRVQGVAVPYWEEVRELIREAAALHRPAPFVGWDVVVTRDGPVVLEGNARPSPVLLQLERGLFEDRRVRRLFGREG
jgi:hypothetical protein